MIYYEKIKEVDEDLIKIQEWQKEQLKKLYAKTEKKINKALAKLGPHMPEEILNGRR